MTNLYKLVKGTNSPSEHAYQEGCVSTVILSIVAMINKHQTTKKNVYRSGLTASEKQEITVDLF